MERICCICGKKKPENLNILGKLICSDCEWKIVCSRVHDKGYKDYIKAISFNADATKVKLADLKDNSDITRLKGLSKKDFDRMEKYHRSFVYLSKI